ncbi:MAG: glycosyltransferase [Rhodospirillales bacterium]|jgi:SAM-dependent methyltransferase|nr:glycosyltransferase [Rhodospirillales bacterium]MBT4626101.1 glycosyltransferase [Rhodospirillales bacterium]MBT6109360.1 glycosyltransferase [Rhodospirillales bacterium]MBT7777622.1 glycosyltransferase [Rhodospirillales bacterium]
MSQNPRQDSLQNFYDHAAPQREKWIRRNQAFYNDDRAYMRFLIPEGLRILELGCGTASLLGELKPSSGVGVDLSPAMIEQAQKNWPNYEYVIGDIEDPSVLAGLEGPFDVVVLSDLLGNLSDVQQTLGRVHKLCTPSTRIIIAYYSPLWEPILRFGQTFGMRMPQPELTWLSSRDVIEFLELADFEPIKSEWRQLLPKRLLGIGTLINRYLSPFPGIRALCLRHYVVARPRPDTTPAKLSATVLVPCRNEKGNIEQAVTRLPDFCEDLEILYVEGGSSDGTLEECERVRDAYPDVDIKVFKQPGKGKGDAVRKGFDEARGDVLIILDADLTVPPEQIPKFYDAIVNGKGEFINGTRFVYPMESGAMRFLNYWANRTFSVIFSWLLNQRFTDTLCGTKVLQEKHYKQIVANRSYFGEFDPFGDFDLIFGAAKLNLKITEIPIRYADRTYGETQISRFRHGVLLLKMVMFAFRKLKAF